MKSRIEGVTLIIESKKNSLPTQKRIFGSLKVSEELDEAGFIEEEALPFPLGVKKRVSLFHRPGYNVSYNTETDKYRISVTIDTKSADWSLDAEDAFCECINYLVRRTHA